MRDTWIRTTTVAVALATVPLVPQPAWARPDPGPTPSATGLERPDGFDPGWDDYSFRAPEPGRSEIAPVEVGPDRTADRPGGSVYSSQVPPEAWVTPRLVPGDSVYRSQVPPAAWDR